MAGEFGRINTSNATGFITISPDPAAVLTNDGETAGPPNFLPTIYAGQTTSIDIGFVINYPIAPEGTSSNPATNVTALYDFAANGMNVSYSGNIVTLSGTFGSVFDNEYYEFVLDDNTLEILPPDTEDPFKALVRYEMPNPVTQNNSYAFNVTGPGETGTVTIQVDVGQWVVWRYQTAVTNIGNLRIRGP